MDAGGVVLGALVAVAAAGAVAAAVTARSAAARAREARGELAATRDQLLQRERSSAEQREVQDLILGAMEEGVLLFDGTGRCAFANGAVERHLDIVPTDIEGLLPLDLQRAAKRAAYTGAVMRAEVETGAPSRWLRASALPVGDGDVLLVIRDVTESRRLDAIRRDFVANASHELKTPVASIRAAAETIRDAAADDPPAVRRFSEQLEREARRLSRIVEDLLDLSRLESGSDLDELVRLDVVASDEVERLEDAAADAGVTVSLAADAVPSVRGSARDLALLIRNLVDNAIRYTPEGGQVDVMVTQRDGDVCVRVADNGVGIPARDLPRVFERFYRVDRARSRDTGGTGLGLAIVRHVTENHAGEVDVESELGRGTTFEVRLPLSRT